MKLCTTDVLTIRWGIEILDVHPYEDTEVGTGGRIKVCVDGDVRVMHMKNVVAINGAER